MSTAEIAIAAIPTRPWFRIARCIASQDAGASSAGRPTTTSRSFSSISAPHAAAP
jgi:hypothetical protein